MIVAPEINATLSKISQAGLPLAISRIAASVPDSRVSKRNDEINDEINHKGNKHAPEYKIINNTRKSELLVEIRKTRNN